MLRLTTLLSYIITLEAIVLSALPIPWFFGFLYYTEVPNVLFVVWTVVPLHRVPLDCGIGLISFSR